MTDPNQDSSEKSLLDSDTQLGASPVDLIGSGFWVSMIKIMLLNYIQIYRTFCLTVSSVFTMIVLSVCYMFSYIIGRCSILFFDYRLLYSRNIERSSLTENNGACKTLLGRGWI